LNILVSSQRISQTNVLIFYCALIEGVGLEKMWWRFGRFDRKHRVYCKYGSVSC